MFSLLLMQKVLNSRFHGGEAGRIAVVGFGEIVELPRLDFENTAPAAQVQLDAVYCNNSVVSFIPALFNACGPSAIARLVVSIDINSVYRKVRAWAFAHVLVKRLKAFAPLFADFDAATAIYFIFLMFFVFATFYHTPPSIVFCGSALAMAIAVATFSQCCGGTFAFKTTATELGFAEIGSRSRGYVSAVASTKPKSIAAAGGCRCSTQDNEASITLPSTFGGLWRHLILISERGEPVNG